jgi:aryl-alcohol dehydrogenase-like predicted oxidoreductase
MDMEYQFLSNTGVQVSRLCLGTMTFGKEADKPTSAAIFKRCRDAGINFIDCADMYVQGESEKILGELIADCREEMIITSKAYFPMGKDRNARGTSRLHIMAAVEASLKRLKTHYIDLYFLHHFDDYTSIEESLRALDDLVKQGKVLYTGASNFAAWQIAKALGISVKEGWNQFKCIQPMYNLVKRMAEVEILPMAQSENLGVITYSPMAGGILTGKYGTNYRSGTTGRLVSNKRYQSRYGEDWVYEVSQQLSDLARESGFHPATLAVAWVAYHPAVTAPIIGGRSVDQLEPLLNAMDIQMTPDLYSRISQLTPKPPPATDRVEEMTDHPEDSRRIGNT